MKSGYIYSMNYIYFMHIGRITEIIIMHNMSIILNASISIWQCKRGTEDD